MIVNTHRLFAKLLPRMRIGAICDVGSMNGADAVIFSAAAPRSRVYAFEPNPLNFRLLEARRGFFQERNISLVPAAASNYDGVAEFFLVDADYSQADPRRGMSSLYRRSGEWASAAAVRVRTTRLDSFLAAECPGDARLAVWIDTEGAAYEVIEGLAGVVERVHLLHVEVETSACIGANQKLYREVQALLRRLGFSELATDHAPSQVQFNALFVRSAPSAWTKLQIRACLVHARLRYLMVLGVCRWCPACLRRYQRMRSGKR
jgi:FkbM family methyltransferase